GESGLSLAREVLKSEEDIAVIMVTGIDDSRIGSIALDFGVYGYLIKPVGIAQLLINIDNALRRRQLERERRSYQASLEGLVLARTNSLREAVGNCSQAQRELCAAQEETI